MKVSGLTFTTQPKGYGKNKWLEKKLEDAENEIDDLYQLLDSIYVAIGDRTISDKEFRDFVYHVILEETGF